MILPLQWKEFLKQEVHGDKQEVIDTLLYLLKVKQQEIRKIQNKESLTIIIIFP